MGNILIKRLVKGSVSLMLAGSILFSSSPAFADPFNFMAPSIPTNNINSLFDTGYSLGSFDIHTGAIMGENTSADMASDFALIQGLNEQNQLALDSAMAAKRAADEAERKKKEAEARKASSGDGPVQTSVGPDGCPTSAPSNTMRKGSDKIGISEMCARSVAGARTPEAAKAIKYALTHVGLPYSQPKRNAAGYYDCSSYVTRAYQAAGLNTAPPGQNAPVVATIITAKWSVKIDFNQRKPGDLVAWDWDGRAPWGDHVAMALIDGWMVHTNKTGDVSHVTTFPKSPYWTGYVEPARARN